MSRLEELLQQYCPNGVEYKSVLSQCRINPKSVIGAKKAELMPCGEVPFFTSGSKVYYVDSYMIDGENIYINDGGVAGFRYYCGRASYADHVISIEPTDIIPKYMYYCLDAKTKYVNDFLFRGTGIKNINRKDFFDMLIPVPPLPVQQEIVCILDKFTELEAELEAELQRRKTQYDFYRDKLLYPDEDVPRVPLESVIYSLNTGLNPRQFFKLNTEDADNYYVTIREIQDGRIVFSDKTDRMNDEGLRLCNNRSNLEVGDVLFSGTGTIGETAVLEETPINWNIKEGVYTIKPKQDCLNSKYLRYLLMTQFMRDIYMKKVAGGTVKSIPMKEMRLLLIPLPSLAEQQRLVDLVERFDALCTDISSGLPAEIEARHKQYEYYRDKLLVFEKLGV